MKAGGKNPQGDFHPWKKRGYYKFKVNFLIFFACRGKEKKKIRDQGKTKGEDMSNL